MDFVEKILYDTAVKLIDQYGPQLKAEIETFVDKLTGEATDKLMVAGLTLVGGALAATIGKSVTDLGKVVADVIPGDADDKIISELVQQFNDFLKGIGK